MDYGLLVIFYYGLLHAFGADHLSAIALFSIGKSKKKTFILSSLFALGHGFMLYLFAQIIHYIADDSLLKYADVVSALVILLMGVYLLYQALSGSLIFDTHKHGNSDDHTHIHYKDNHLHDKNILFSLGLLMGIGGVRGMLVTLSAISHNNVGIELILAFVAGVSIVFLLFGYLVYLANQKLFRSSYAFRVIGIGVGLFSITIGLKNIIEII